jgi:hypothetical protein
MAGKWQRVVSAARLWAKGDGWWDIELACGHRAAVLHGNASPLGEYCKCFYQCLAALRLGKDGE